MSAQDTTLAIFGDAELGIWGLLLDGEQPRLAVARLDSAPEDVRLEPASLDRDDDRIWTVTAEGLNLRFEKAVATTATAEGLPLEPIRVTGVAALDGSEHELDIGGLLTQAAVRNGTESVRLLGSWFPAGHQVALQSSRPRGSKGQDKDVIDVVALGEREPAVFDPRLSTTYDGNGGPRSAGIELWIGADEDGDQYPRRVAGVATGARVSDAEAGLRLDAYAFDCLSRGEVGVGVYVLLRAS